jgi:hypothetical protein
MCAAKVSNIINDPLTAGAKGQTTLILVLDNCGLELLTDLVNTIPLAYFPSLLFAFLLLFILSILFFLLNYPCPLFSLFSCHILFYLSFLSISFLSISQNLIKAGIVF